MSGLLGRYSSYSSQPHHIRPSPSKAADSPPLDPFPPTPNALKPSDVLINRSHQLKRFAKHLALYFQALSQAHHAHSLALQKLPSTIPTPIQESSIFLPSSSVSSSSSSDPNSSLDMIQPLGGTGQEGWAQILQEIKDTNQRVSLAHAELAKSVVKEVVGPLNKLREGMKGHINAMEKDVNRLCDAVQRERDLTSPLLARLQQALSTQPIRPQLNDDPLVIRAQLEAQLSVQLQKENDLLVAVKSWTEKTEVKEKELFSELAKCWRDWESTNSAMLLGNQQLSMFLSATVDSVPPESEWSHFLKLNHAIPADAPTKTLKDVEWEGKGDERCGILLEGALERQTSFLRSWKAAYFILTATGHLLLYAPPTLSSTSSSSPASRSRASTVSAPPPQHHSLSTSVPSPSSSSEEADSTSLSSLSPTAFHLLTTSTPLLTLHLPTCSLGPMPTPDHEKKKKGGLDAAFTLIENEGKGTKHIMRAVPSKPGEEIADGADEWETMGGWIKEISKFTLPAPPSPTLPSLPTSPSTVSLASGSALQTPPALPSRSFSSSAVSNSATSPPLPQLPSPPLASSESIAPTPASTSIFGGFFGGGRSSVASSTTTSKSLATTTDATTTDDDEHEHEVDLGASPPPLPPRDRERDQSFGSSFSHLEGAGDAQPITIVEDQLPQSPAEEEEEEEGERTADEFEEDRGDLGRSLSPPPPPPSAALSSSRPTPTLPSRTPPPSLPPRAGSGRVAGLAKAFDQEASKRKETGSGLITSPKMGEVKNLDQEEGPDGPEEDVAANTGGGKKNGKKNKKKKSNKALNDSFKESTESTTVSALEPVPSSSSPKFSDLSLASPPLDLGETQLELDFDQSRDATNNPFDLSLSHLQIDPNNEGDEAGDLSGISGPGELSFDEEKLEREYGSPEFDHEHVEEEGEKGEISTPPPMVLEEVEEGPQDDGQKDGEENKE
ncbi:uncharacterized protein JCM6883_002863 [Sporobolomyces salmoneus]|uniref:uncharacterized protein n=1 Tax=Sporobolomyces salmoneus TaxID=183962 RepID=UPI00317097BD